MGVDSKGEAGVSQASAWIRRWARHVQTGADMLDLACGSGRNGRHFLALGHPVLFLDIDLSGLTDLQGQPGVELLAADLENGSPWPLGNRQFGVVVATNYLWRPLFPHVIRATAPGGLLLYETFLRGQENHGRPTNPDFLLAENELFERLKDSFHILAFEQGEETEPKPSCRQRIAAVKR